MSVFDLNDCYTKDEVTIYRSKTQLYFRVFMIIVLIFFLISQLCCLDTSKKSDSVTILFSLFMGIVTLGSIFSTINFYQKLNDFVVRISIKGIETDEEVFVCWENIENERVESVSDGDSSTSFLLYYCRNFEMEVKVSIDELNISENSLAKAIKIFRNRSTSQNINQI